jgi:hypothetical protein
VAQAFQAVQAQAKACGYRKLLIECNLVLKVLVFSSLPLDGGGLGGGGKIIN